MVPLRGSISGDRAPNLTVEHCKIIGGNLTNSGILGGGTFVGNDISHVGIGIQLKDGASTVDGNYVHDLYYGSADPHYDGVVCLGTQNHVLIQNNTISLPNGNGTAAVFIDNDFGSVNDVTVRNNLMFGDPAYTVHVDQKAGLSGVISNIVIENNYLEKGYYGYVAVNGTKATVSNNVQWDNNRDPIPYPSSPPTDGTPAPSAPVIASFSQDTGVVGDGITSANKLTLTGTAAANSTVKVFDGTKQIGTATASATGSWSFVTTALTDAKHVLTATATDAAGKSSVASAALTVTVDTQAPAAPVLLTDTTVNTNQVKLSGTAEANSSIKVYDGKTLVGSGTADAKGNWAITTGALSQGTHSLTATATDAAGNVSAVSQARDPVVGTTPSQVPAPSILSISPDSGIKGDLITNVNKVTLSGSAVANSTVTVFEGTTKVGTATVDSKGAWSLTTSTLNDGVHHFTAIDNDSAGNKSVASADFAVTIDTHAPVAPTLAHYSQAGAAVGATTTFNDLLLKGTAEANSTVSIWDNGKQIATVTAGSAGTWSFDTGTLASGAHSFISKATDVAGNTSVASVADVVTVNPTSAAVGSIKFTGLHGDVPNSVVNLTGTAAANSLIKFYDNGKLIGETTTKSYGGWSFTTDKPLSDTVHAITAQEYNSSGKLVGTSAGSIVVGSSSGDTLKSTSGDDILSGHGGGDTFVFAPHFGNDVIKNFTATGPTHDVIQFSTATFSDFASVLSHATQQGNDVVISSGADSLKLTWTKLSSLTSQDFHFA